MSGRLVALAVVGLGSVIAAQQAPPRDARPDSVVGPGAITGIVLSDDLQPKPMRRVRVTLSGAELLGGRIIITDDSGTFRFTDLPAGRFTLSASRPAFLTANYGAKRPGGDGVSVALSEGQVLANLSLKLHRGAVITGRVLDERGRPLAGADVGACRASYVTGKPEWTACTPAVTDDLGTYRAFGLLPGEYVVRATRGGGLNLRTLQSGEVEAALGPQRAGAPVPQSDTTVGYSRTYYPGISLVADAGLVKLAVGEEASGIDIQTRLVPTARVSGTVTALTGIESMAGLQVRLFGATSASGVNGSVSGSGATRQFLFVNVFPGHYTILAWAGGPGGSSAGAAQWASATVDVNGQQIADIALEFKPGFSVSGRVVFEDIGNDPPPPGWMIGVSTVLDGTRGAAFGPPAQIAPDSTFVVRGLTPAAYRVRATSMTPTDSKARFWALKSATVNGADVADAFIDLQSGVELTDVVVTMSAVRTDLTGLLQTASGDAAPDLHVIVFPVNRAFWTVSSRHIKATRPGTDGRYRFVGLPAGEYYLAAVTDVEQGQWFDPGFLGTLVPGAVRLSLADGEKKTQDIRVR